jgi:hypothetical protein
MNRLMIVAAASAASILMNCGFAYAADLPLEPAYIAPVAPLVPAYNWTGIYLGCPSSDNLRQMAV